MSHRNKCERQNCQSCGVGHWHWYVVCGQLTWLLQEQGVHPLALPCCEWEQQCPISLYPSFSHILTHTLSLFFSLSLIFVFTLYLVPFFTLSLSLIFSLPFSFSVSLSFILSLSISIANLVVHSIYGHTRGYNLDNSIYSPDCTYLWSILTIFRSWYLSQNNDFMLSPI